MPDTAPASRQAKRRVTRFYDQFQASVGLRTTQFSILPRAINVLGPDIPEGHKPGSMGVDP
jgi:hypothetical protein